MTHTFQSIIIQLQNFWASRGCLIWQPYYTQVGAGTMTPATFLRVLGPERWNVAYVEPSVRPDDGRYGENPNRPQMRDGKLVRSYESREEILALAHEGEHWGNDE